MKISKIHLTNFKRFSDLWIDNIPETAKLVLLIGSNGSGKSCVLDAYGCAVSMIIQDIAPGSESFLSYYRKKSGVPFEVSIHYHPKDNVIWP